VHPSKEKKPQGKRRQRFNLIESKSRRRKEVIACAREVWGDKWGGEKER